MLLVDARRLFGDQAHSLNYTWRSLGNLQSLAIGGKCAGVLKPFDTLKVDELRQELRERGVVDTSMVKPILTKILEDILRGVVRVPALLLTDPPRSLSSLTLDMYEAVASEALHDLKGHNNLIMELPHVLPDDDIKTQCTHLISCCLAKDKESGADLRRVVIQLFLLKDVDSSTKLLLLLQTIIKSVKFCTQETIRDLLDNCWLHMELTPKKIGIQDVWALLTCSYSSEKKKR